MYKYGIDSSIHFHHSINDAVHRNNLTQSFLLNQKNFCKTAVVVSKFPTFVKFFKYFQN